jgi:uncharacterized lipoprotein YddW (UPF0748 family)
MDAMKRRKRRAPMTVALLLCTAIAQLVRKSRRNRRGRPSHLTHLTFLTYLTSPAAALPLCSLFLAALAALPAHAATYNACNVVPPPPAREFRAAWIATVGNIDWPSAKGLPTAAQKAELVAILDRAAQLKLNAVIFQVRPACDAMYASKIEPWSEYLTGAMGRAPSPFYDPLAFAIEEAHRRGLELHAWFNPYRALHGSSKSPVPSTHITKTHPQLVRRYGRQLWLDPGEPEVQNYSLSVIMDVVRRYDIDGVHFDDYFYPYKEPDANGEDMDFPDDASWRRLGAGGALEREGWRRENVNSFVRRVYQSIKATRPRVKFGISPFGIWRPGYPPQIQGLDAYAELYADSRKWLMNGWVDYLAPQLYWAIEPPDQSFPVLLKWWTEQNPKGRHLWAGLDSTKASPKRTRDEGRTPKSQIPNPKPQIQSPKAEPESRAERTGDSWRTRARWDPQEILNQIRLTRKQPGASGHIHWNMKSLMRSSALDEALEREVYTQPALVPASPWLDNARPEKPRLTAGKADRSAALSVSWAPSVAGKAWLWLLQTRTGSVWKTEVLPAARTSRNWAGAPPEVVAVSAVDRNGNASAAAALELRR